MTLPTYPLYITAGPPRELGRIHGEQARDKIRGYLDYLQKTLGLSRAAMRRRAEVFEPLFQRQCARLLEEVAGLADGALIHHHDALAVQLRSELAAVPDGACTAFAIARSQSSDDRLLIGQNSDNQPELIDYGYVLRLVPEQGPRILIWTFGGMLGYHGLNEYGLAHFANSLGGGPPWKFALSHYPLNRLMLEQPNLAGVRQLMSDVAVCSNGNYVLCDGSGEITDIELTSEGPYEVDMKNCSSLVHANHYLRRDLAGPQNRALGLPDSEARQHRLQELIAAHRGQLTLEDLQRFLSDHQGYPTGICRHSHSGPDYPMLSSRGQTIASLVADPDHGCLHVARGNPCTAHFVTYRLADN